MNRLILLGNGFDLAHGLKTGYNDFILWYLKDCFTKAYDSHTYEDELISITREQIYNDLRYGNIIDGVSQYIDYYYKNGFAELISNFELKLLNTVYQPFFDVNVKSRFLEHLLANCKSNNWVDIENEYYEELKSKLVLANDIYKSKELTELNQTLEVLINRLADYLKALDDAPTLNGYFSIFEEEILTKDVVTIRLDNNAPPNITKVLNFNYTNTVQNYFVSKAPYFSDFKFEVNYIHGWLVDNTNPIIFGFGDELDEAYLQMEHEKTRGFLEFIKSFWYFKTSNYHDLIRFIDSDNFQIFILGHSCGLSDRTMLNMIFEHENCKSIKIFYHEYKGKTNFTTLTQEISKHFKDKGEMRKKIVPFNYSSPMPQIGN